MERKGEINIIGQSNLCQENFEYSDKKRIFKFELVDPECLDDIVLNLEMVKTETQDVYKLFGIFTGIQNKKTIFIKKILDLLIYQHIFFQLNSNYIL